MNWKAKTFVTVMASLGMLVIAQAVWTWHSADPVKFLCFLAIALVASTMKVSLPGIDGTMSVNFLFILIGILDLSFGETVLMGCASTLFQCFWKAKQRVQPIHVLFNVAGMMAPAIAASYMAFNAAALLLNGSTPVMLLVAALTYFVANTLPVAVVISLAEKKKFRAIWSECYFWSLPYYLVGAGIAGLVSYLTQIISWQTSLLVLPVVYWIFRSYRLYLGRLEAEKRHVEVEKQHVEEMAALHMRTIEALALAIDAKDHTTHDHLQRVRVYATEIGKELNLSEDELNALRAAALLHDIGKLAVPEHILNKPGKLTAEEFEKLKIHPVVGAEILERVKFPYPVAPIVRAHHEKWDGSGYPYGLSGHTIPIGARILSAVDCLDALASDRQYRRALPLEVAIAEVVRCSGKDFDPQVVEILHRRHRELEMMARSTPMEGVGALSTDIKVERGASPAAGFQEPLLGGQSDAGFLSSIAAARHEAQGIYELSHDLGQSLHLEETLSMIGTRLRRLVPYDSMVIYVREQERLLPKYSTGDNFRLFSRLEIPVGQGLVGWSAGSGQPMINGDPAVELGYKIDPARDTVLRSALVQPLDSVQGVVGVLAVYRADASAFTRDHLRILQAISSKLALCIENALKFQQAENSSVTDFLTGLPNARSLFLHLEHELARIRRTGRPLGVMVCDLNGFKSVNDRFGHLEGNRVLQIFAEKLTGICREYDYIARMGGDEFVIVAEGLQASQADEKVAAINQIAVNAGLEVCQENILSASVGTAFYGADGEDAEQLLAAADRRMYGVKQLHHKQKAPLGVVSKRAASTPAVN